MGGNWKWVKLSWKNWEKPHLTWSRNHLLVRRVMGLGVAMGHTRKENRGKWGKVGRWLWGWGAGLD